MNYRRVLASAALVAGLAAVGAPALAGTPTYPPTSVEPTNSTVQPATQVADRTESRALAFTGAELGLGAGVGAALVGGGILLHRVSRTEGRRRA